MEFIAQILIEFLMVIPGAFIRWLWFKGKYSFKELVTDRSAYNYIFSFLIIGIIIIIGINISKN
jgi:hypothetical protein